jgi:hypothetical protein
MSYARLKTNVIVRLQYKREEYAEREGRTVAAVAATTSYGVDFYYQNSY